MRNYSDLIDCYIIFKLRLALKTLHSNILVCSSGLDLFGRIPELATDEEATMRLLLDVLKMNYEDCTKLTGLDSSLCSGFIGEIALITRVKPFSIFHNAILIFMQYLRSESKYHELISDIGAGNLPKSLEEIDFSTEWKYSESQKLIQYLAHKEMYGYYGLHNPYCLFDSGTNFMLFIDKWLRPYIMKDILNDPTLTFIGPSQSFDSFFLFLSDQSSKIVFKHLRNRGGIELVPELLKKYNLLQFPSLADKHKLEPIKQKINDILTNLKELNSISQSIIGPNEFETACNEIRTRLDISYESKFQVSFFEKLNAQASLSAIMAEDRELLRKEFENYSYFYAILLISERLSNFINPRYNDSVVYYSNLNNIVTMDNVDLLSENLESKELTARDFILLGNIYDPMFEIVRGRNRVDAKIIAKLRASKLAVMNSTVSPILVYGSQIYEGDLRYEHVISSIPSIEGLKDPVAVSDFKIYFQYKEGPLITKGTIFLKELNRKLEEAVASFFCDSIFKSDMTKAEQEDYKELKKISLNNLGELLAKIRDYSRGSSSSTLDIKSVAKSYFYGVLNSIPEQLRVKNPDALLLDVERILYLIRLFFDNHFEKGDKAQIVICNTYDRFLNETFEKFAIDFKIQDQTYDLVETLKLYWRVLHQFGDDSFKLKPSNFEDYVDQQFKLNPLNRLTLVKIARFWMPNDFTILDNYFKEACPSITEPKKASLIYYNKILSLFELAGPDVSDQIRFSNFYYVVVLYEIVCLYNPSYSLGNPWPFRIELKKKVFESLEKLLDFVDSIDFPQDVEKSPEFAAKMASLVSLEIFHSKKITEATIPTGTERYEFLFKKLAKDIDLLTLYARFMDPESFNKFIHFKEPTYHDYLQKAVDRFDNELDCLPPSELRAKVASKFLVHKYLLYGYKGNYMHFYGDLIENIKVGNDQAIQDAIYISSKQEISVELVKLLERMKVEDFSLENPEVQVLISKLKSLRQTREDLKLRDSDLGIVKLDLDPSPEEVLFLFLAKFPRLRLTPHLSKSYPLLRNKILGAKEGK